MRILYVAKHGSGGNQDEEAIAYALAQLGHEVFAVPEQPRREIWDWPKADLCLFHKWDDVNAMVGIDCPKVFWYFDLVDHADPLLALRSVHRKAWMERVLPHVDLGFCTDGDWVERRNHDQESDKLIQLSQGFDDRIKTAPTTLVKIDLLFTGLVRKCGKGRSNFLADMMERYGERFKHVAAGSHGKNLAELIAQSKIVVAPDAPVSNKYWSNRVYWALGLGGFLLHPWTDGLARQYPVGDGWEPRERGFAFYHDRIDLHDKIGFYLKQPEERLLISSVGRARTLAEHTYTCRVRKLLEVVKERLKI